MHAACINHEAEVVTIRLTKPYKVVKSLSSALQRCHMPVKCITMFSQAYQVLCNVFTNLSSALQCFHKLVKCSTCTTLSQACQVLYNTATSLSSALQHCHKLASALQHCHKLFKCSTGLSQTCQVLYKVVTSLLSALQGCQKVVTSPLSSLLQICMKRLCTSITKLVPTNCKFQKGCTSLAEPCDNLR